MRWRNLLFGCWLVVLVQESQPVGAAGAIVAGTRTLDSDQDQRLVGELLLSELGCLGCHQRQSLPGATVTPWRVKTGPVLESAARRLRPEFLRAFLNDPQAAKPGTTMPHVLHDLPPQRRQMAVEALSQYLYSLAERQGPEPAWPVGDRSRGRRLFHSIGCVACHAPEEGYRPEALDLDAQLPPLSSSSVPLGDLHSKYWPEGLATFLLNPLEVRPHGRMPRVVETKAEAADLAAYLLGERAEGAVIDASDTRRVEAGRELFAKLRCDRCHDLREDTRRTESTPAADDVPALMATSRDGCLAASPPASAPLYSLSSPQRQAIRVSLAASTSLTAEDTRRGALAAWNCLACHTLGEHGGPEPGRAVFFRSQATDLGDEGRFPPPLDHSERKFYKRIIESILSGHDRVRPYLLTRMPDFGVANAGQIADAIRLSTDDASDPEVVGRNRYGRRLVGTQGMSCISCHDMAGHRSLGVRAVDLAVLPRRVRPQWFRDYLLAPHEYRPGTRMPNFWPEGKSVVPDVLRGDPTRQSDAIWVYLSEVSQTRLPEGMERGDVFEVVPREGPVVFRTFMKDVGTHAIAVGFPTAVHAAFDAEDVHLASAWKGKFLDAESTWDDRFVPPTVPLGDDVILFPSGPTLAILPNDKAPWPDIRAQEKRWRFDGYRLNDKREPMFLYRWHPMRITDHVAARPDGKGLRRRLRIEGEGESVWLRVARGREIERVFRDGFEIDGKWRVFFSSLRRDPVLRIRGGQKEIVVPVIWSRGKADIVYYVEW